MPAGIGIGVSTLAQRNRRRRTHEELIDAALDDDAGLSLPGPEQPEAPEPDWDWMTELSARIPGRRQGAVAVA